MLGPTEALDQADAPRSPLVALRESILEISAVSVAGADGRNRFSAEEPGGVGSDGLWLG